MMTPQEREALRLTLLRLLNSNRTDYGMAKTLLLAVAKPQGFSGLTRDMVGDELEYLEQKGFVVRVPKPISPELTTWKISAAGRDFLAERGLDDEG